MMTYVHLISKYKFQGTHAIRTPTQCSHTDFIEIIRLFIIL